MTSPSGIPGSVVARGVRVPVPALLPALFLVFGTPAPALAQEEGSVPAACASTADLQWMVGAWRQETQGTVFHERWRPGEGGVLIGEARSVSEDGSEVYQDEDMRIAAEGGTLVYAADPDGDGEFVKFTLATCDDRSVTFENAAHDFPNRLSYRRTDDGGLTASVTDLKGQGFDLEFRPDPDG
jgi:hypothetical protein